jgi:large subunit ribosomal protein L16
MLLRAQDKRFKKERKGKITGNCIDKVHFGKFGIKAITGGRLTARQLEASRIVISRRIKGLGKLWIRVFPDTPISQKPNENRMGRGKGAVSFWISKIRPGKILYEIDGNITLKKMLEIKRAVSFKLPFVITLVDLLNFNIKD